MESTTPVLAETEPKPTKEHRTQVLWQIWLPLILSIGMVICIAVSMIGAGTIAIQKYANLSTIYLIIPNMVVGLVILVLISAMIYGLLRLFSVFLIYSRLVQDYFFNAAVVIRLWSDKAAAPFLSIRAGLAGLRAFLSHFVN
jgi:hypothetical protein